MILALLLVALALAVIAGGVWWALLLEVAIVADRIEERDD